MASAAPSARRTRAVESFGTAAACIGEVTKGMALFAVTRGQFSMIDAVLAVLAQVGPARLTLWTWTIADYEVDVCVNLINDGRITSGELIINGERPKLFTEANTTGKIIDKWRARFGPLSVKNVMNHSKIATVETADFRLLLRGSMNLNFNPRFEQLDITEGGPDFDLVRQIESELPVLPDHASSIDRHRASKTTDAFDAGTIDMFAGAKSFSGPQQWRPTARRIGAK